MTLPRVITVAAAAVAALVAVILWLGIERTPTMPALPTVEPLPVGPAACPAPDRDCYLTDVERASLLDRVERRRDAAHRALVKVAERRRAYMWGRGRSLAAAAVAIAELAALTGDRRALRELDDGALVRADGHYQALDEQVFRQRFETWP